MAAHAHAYAHTHCGAESRGLGGGWARTAAILCVGFDDGNATWTATQAGSPATLATGSCDSYFYVAYGSTYRGCDITGAWQSVQNPCLRTARGRRARSGRPPRRLTAPRPAAPGRAPQRCCARPSPRRTATRRGPPRAPAPSPTASARPATTAARRAAARARPASPPARGAPSSRPAKVGCTAVACTLRRRAALTFRARAPPHATPTAIFCVAVDDSGTANITATFPATQATQTGVGTCVAGLYGFPQRLCNANGNNPTGVWAASVSANPCSCACDQPRRGGAALLLTRASRRAMGGGSRRAMQRPRARRSRATATPRGRWCRCSARTPTACATAAGTARRRGCATSAAGTRSSRPASVRGPAPRVRRGPALTARRDAGRCPRPPVRVRRVCLQRHDGLQRRLRPGRRRRGGDADLRRRLRHLDGRGAHGHVQPHGRLGGALACVQPCAGAHTHTCRPETRGGPRLTGLWGWRGRAWRACRALVRGGHVGVGPVAVDLCRPVRQRHVPGRLQRHADAPVRDQRPVAAARRQLHACAT